MAKLHPLLKALLLTLAMVLGVFLAALALANLIVLEIGGPRIKSELEELPRQATGLVLGTSPRSARKGGANPFFEMRMDAAAALYHAGVVKRLLLSGDNRRADYNEPAAMREAMRQRGLPDNALALDYAGFRTLDSVVRARKVFQLEEGVVIITDDFHLPRALFLADQTGLKAVGFAGRPVPWSRSARTRIREWFSRARAILDIYLWNTQPHFLGDPVPFPPQDTESSAVQETPAASETTPPEALPMTPPRLPL